MTQIWNGLIPWLGLGWFGPRASTPDDGPCAHTDRRRILNRMVQYSPTLDRHFAALADPTRRGILARLGRDADASISDLAAEFGMTLTGVKKHVGVLEDAGLVATRKVGRVRRCTLGPERLDAELAWLEAYRRMLMERLDHLEKFLDTMKGTKP